MQVFDSLRCFPDRGGVLKNYAPSCGEHKVTRVRDQSNGFDSGEADLKSRLPTTPGAHMITFTFENGCVATLRGSGTEPKLKYYVEVIGRDKESAEGLRAAMQQAIMDNWLQPPLSA